MISRVAYAVAGAALVLAIEAGLFFIPAVHEMILGPHTFAECAAQFGTAQGSYPPACKTPAGRVYQDVPQGNEQLILYSDLNAPLSSPVVIDVAVPEGTAPVSVFLMGAGGESLASTTLLAGAQEGAFVHQSGTLIFPAPHSGTAGTITFLKTGQPLIIPVLFK